MNDIPQYFTFIKIEAINKGWSSDKKYYIETASGQKLLLRLSDISEYKNKKAEYEAVIVAAKLGIHMSMPIDFGVCNAGSQVYMLLTWIDEEDAEIILPTLPESKQYDIGLKAGKMLKKIHSIKAPDEHLQPTYQCGGSFYTEIATTPFFPLTCNQMVANI